MNCDEVTSLVKLVQVKRGIYNPYQPSYRQRDVDNQLGKLHDEQRVTTLPRGLDSYSQDPKYQYMSPSSYVRGYSVLSLYQNQCMLPKNNSDLSFLEHCKWADLRRRLPMPDKRIINLPNMRESTVFNYCVRDILPEERESWRRKLNTSSNINEKYIDDLFPQLQIHECPCTKPKKSVQQTEDLCTETKTPTTNLQVNDSNMDPRETAPRCTSCIKGASEQLNINETCS